MADIKTTRKSRSRYFLLRKKSCIYKDYRYFRFSINSLFRPVLICLLPFKLLELDLKFRDAGIKKELLCHNQLFLHKK